VALRLWDSCVFVKKKLNVVEGCQNSYHNQVEVRVSRGLLQNKKDVKRPSTGIEDTPILKLAI
jgi:hypothetical protein